MTVDSVVDPVTVAEEIVGRGRIWIAWQEARWHLATVAIPPERKSKKPIKVVTMTHSVAENYPLSAEESNTPCGDIAPAFSMLTDDPPADLRCGHCVKSLQPKPVKEKKRKAAVPGKRGSYAGVIYRGGVVGDDDAIIWTCTHQHRTKAEARDCGEKSSRTLEGLNENGHFVSTAAGLN